MEDQAATAALHLVGQAAVDAEHVVDGTGDDHVLPVSRIRGEALGEQLAQGAVGTDHLESSTAITWSPRILSRCSLICSIGSEPVNSVTPSGVSTSSGERRGTIAVTGVRRAWESMN